MNKEIAKELGVNVGTMKALIQLYNKERQIEMSDTSRVPVSSRRKEEFLNQVIRKNNITRRLFKRVE